MGITKELKEKIKAMKKSGYTITKISAVTGVPTKIVETICSEE